VSSKAERASLFVDDTQFLAHLLARAPHLKLVQERWRTARPGLVVGALALTAFAATWALDLSPAKGLASTMPEKARASLGAHVIRTMPAKGTCNHPEGRRALDTLVRRLMPNGPVTGDNVTVLDWNVLNAFAVPGHRIVLSRRIIEEAITADEIAGVIGHEAGHSAELHPEASLVRSVGFWALVQMMFTGTPGAVGNIGSVLVQLGYTRSAERAADDHALKLLRQASISPKGMADFFRRMDAVRPGQGTTKATGASDLFSSHPSNAERIRAIETQAAYAATPAMAAEDWKALKGICTPVNDQPVMDKSAADRAAEKAVANAKAAADKAAADKAVADAARVAAAAKVAAEKAAAEKIAAEKAAAEELAEAKRQADAKAAAAQAQAEAKRAAEAKSAPQPDATQVAAATGVAGAAPSADPRIDAATKRIAANPHDAGGYFERGQAYASKRQPIDAIDDFTRALELQPADVPTLFWRASQFSARKQFDLAIADYNEVIRLQPKNYAALNNRGSIYRSQRKLDLAIKDFTTAISVDSKQPMALTNRALAHRDRSELDAAIVDLTAALSANAKNPVALARRGETHELKAAKEAAIADYRAVLKLPEPAGAPSEPHKTARARLIALGETP
jgi:beta-barrel assembly-enhancing protease